MGGKRFKRGQTFGETIASLEIEYGSQKEAAERLGVSTRTLRRWKNRTKPPSGGGTAYDPDAIERRVRYFRREKRREPTRDRIDPETIDRLPDRIVLNDYIRTEWFATAMRDLDSEQRPLVQALLRDRPNVQIIVAKETTSGGKTVVRLPSSNYGLQRRINLGDEIEYYNLADDFYEDFGDIESALWHIFQEAYKSDEG